MSAAEKVATTDDEPSMEEILDSIRKIIDTDDEEPAEATAEESPAAETAEEDVLELTQMVQEDGSVVDLDDPDAVIDLSADEQTIESVESTVEEAEENLEEDEDPLAGLENFTAEEPEENVQQAEPESDIETEPVPEELQDELIQTDVEDNIGELTEDLPAPEPATPEVTFDDTFPEDALLEETPLADEETSIELEEPTPEPTAPIESMEETMPAEPEEDALLSTEAATATAAALSSLKDILGANTKVNNDHTLEDIVAALLKPLLKQWLDQNLPELVERKVQEEIQRLTDQS